MKESTDLKFPIRYKDGTPETCGIDDDIRQSLYLLLSTRRGERVMRPNYGCDLEQFAFERVNYDLLSRIENEVTRAIALNEPRVENVKVTLESSDEQIINTENPIIIVSYTVKENAHEQSLRVQSGGKM